MAALAIRKAPATVEDIRFRALLGREAWDGLPPAVQRRFARRIADGQASNYCGVIVDCVMNPVGWLLAQACRLIGAPLPLDRTPGMAAVVSVTEDGASGGQVWSRLYARPASFPQVIHSAKRFAGPTGLEEYLGHGFGIALRVSALPQGIRFASDHYFLMVGPLRLRLPAWLAPGTLLIDHEDLGGGQFTFTLTLRHRLFGRLMRQRSRFCDCTTGDGQ
jgi:hypothetical protein